MGPPPSLLVDCDPGLDDAIALLVLVALDSLGRVALKGVSAVGGNMPVDITCRNAAFVLERAGRSDVAVHAGASRSLTPERGPRADVALFHGEDGLGGLYVPGRPRPAPASGVDVLVAFRGAVLATGPLTDVALALDADTGLNERVSRVVVMGGALGHPSGNVTAAAEFNWWSDPVAADRVCRSGLPLEIVPLDVTERVVFTAADVQSVGPFAAQLLAARIALQSAALGREGEGWVHDAVAAALFDQPALARWEPMTIRVETEGQRAGAVIVKDGPPTCRVAVEIDAERTRRRIREILGST